MTAMRLLRSIALGLVALGGLSPRAWASPNAPFLVVRAGPEESVTSVAVSPDGALVAVNAFDGRIRILDARTGALLRAIGAESEPGGRTVAFAPDGRTLAAAGFHLDKRVKVWDSRTGALVRALDGHDEIETYALAFSPDGARLASAGTDKQILVWDLETGALRRRIRGLAAPVIALAFSPDGRTLAGGSEGAVRLWDATTGELRRSLGGRGDWFAALAFAPDGRTLAGGSCDWAYHRGRDPSRFGGRDPGSRGEWRLWDVATGGLRRVGAVPGRLLSLAVAPDGSSLACGSGSDVHLHDLRGEAPGRVVASHDGLVSAVAFAPDGRSLLSGGHDRTARRVALASGEEEWRLRGYWDQVNSVAPSADGALLAAGSGDLRFAEGSLKKAGARDLGPGAVRLWDARNGRLLRRLGDPAEQVLAVALSPDGRRVAGGGGRPDGPGLVRLWDTGTGEPAWSDEGRKAEVLALAFAPDGSTLAGGGADGLIRIHDAATGAVVRTLTGLEGGATSVAYSADGATLAGGAADGTSRLWDARDGRLLHTLRPPAPAPRPASDGVRATTVVAFGADGATLATGRHHASADPAFVDPDVRFWDPRTGTPKEGRPALRIRGRFAALSPDGETVATLGKAIILWDVTTGKPLRELPGHLKVPHSAAFSADGRRLVSGGAYRRTIAWEVATGRPLATLSTFSESHPGTASDDWLALAADGSFDGSPGIAEYLSWRAGDALLPANRLAPQLHRPDRLESSLEDHPRGRVSPQTGDPEDPNSLER